MEDKSKDCPHCYHPTGGGYSWGVGGEETFRCCHCGKIIHRTYTYKQDPDHGPYAPQSVKTWDMERDSAYSLNGGVQLVTKTSDV